MIVMWDKLDSKLAGAWLSGGSEVPLQLENEDELFDWIKVDPNDPLLLCYVWHAWVSGLGERVDDLILKFACFLRDSRLAEAP